MVRERAIGAVAFGAAALGGMALGFLGERRVLAGQTIAAAAETEVPHPSAVPGRALDVVAEDRTLLHAEVSGRPDPPSIVFSHGVGLSSATWHHQRRQLGARFHTVAFDHRGHGRSARAATGDYSLEAMGRDLARVVEAATPDGPVVLVGHSMGSMAVLALCGERPDLLDSRVRGIVLCNTAKSSVLSGAAASAGAAAIGTLQARLQGSFIGRSERARRRLESSEPADRPSTDLSLLVTKQFGLNPDASPEMVAFLEEQVRATAPVVLGSCAPALANVDLRAAAQHAQVPALVIAGERDRMTPPRQARKLVETLPDAELLEIPGVGHTAMIEDPEAVTAAIERFADRVLARRAA